MGENEYGISGILYACFLAPKIKYCLVIVNYGVILAEKTFKGYNEEHKMIKLDESIPLLEEKTVTGRLLIDWTETFEGIKILHKKQDCLDCENT